MYNPQSFNSVYSVDDLLWAVLLFLIFCEMKIVMSENKNLEQYRGNTFSPTRRHKGSSVLTLNSCPSLCTGQSWHPNLSLPRTEEHLWRSRDPLVTPLQLHALQRGGWEKLCTSF